MSAWVWVAVAIGLILLAMVLLSLKSRQAITRKLTSGGRQVLRMRGKLFRSPFAHGLSPLGYVYWVTMEGETEGSKTSTKLYAYDAGQWFSRHNAEVRQYSGGVWRDA